MNNNSRNIKSLVKVILVSALISSLPAYADISADINRCTKIQDNNDRLTCFDTVAAYYKTFPAAEPKANKEPVRPAVGNTPSQEINAPVSIPKPTKEIVTSEDAFGRSSAELVQIESLKSNIVGEFRGWKKGSTLTLKNGQKWKVVSRTTGYVKLQNPAVEITRGVFGSFNMKVNGLNAVAKVRRVD
ncbi:hypothetical protein [Aliikangiella coralliicola]|uniref:SH3 domain-containing protein n=1 Tax=Aliikangiella coralliicola TaxID=2592383 RepID=A0A545UHL9_9GAMM|nr:hypothetical protein [Aliikangiella coralliicola]TQV88971.1 hypothetical protein FLL46_05420 [Aliikangiella coralliicola]